MADGAAPSIDDILASVPAKPSKSIDDILATVPSAGRGHAPGTSSPASLAPPTSSRDANDVRPSSRDVAPDWQPEGGMDYLRQRGRQVAEGAAEGVAALPEAASIAGATIDTAKSKAAAELLDKNLAEVRKLENYLRQPGLAESDRLSAQTRIEQLRSGLGRLFVAANRPITPAGKRPIFQTGDDVRSAVAGAVGSSDKRDDSTGGMIATGIGQVGGMIATAAATGPLSVPLTIMQASAMNSSQMYKEAIAAGASEEDAQAAAKVAAVTGSLDALPIFAALKFVPPALRGKITNPFIRKLGAIAADAGVEGVQEYADQVLNNLNAMGVLPGTKEYDANRSWNEGALQAAIVGATVGGVVGGAVSTHDKKGKKVDTGQIAADQTEALNTAATPPPTTAGVAPRPPAAPVAPDEAEALGVPKPPVAERVRGVMKKPAEEVTSEGKTEAPAEPPSVPESPETIAAQQEALAAGTKKAVLYPDGGILPKETGDKNIKRIRISGVGTVDYNSKQITAKEIFAFNTLGRLNELLDLGPYNKQDAAESIAQGNQPTAVVERKPDSTAVKAAPRSSALAPEQVAAFEQTKAAPENQVVVQQPQEVIQERLQQAPPPPFVAQPPVAPPAPVEPPPQPVAPPTQAVPAPAPVQPPAAPPMRPSVDPAAQKVREATIRSLEPQLAQLGLTVDEVLAKPIGWQQQAITEAKGLLKSAQEAEQAVAKPAKKPRTPKAEAAVEVSKPGTRVEVDEKTGKRRVIRTDEETVAATEEFNKGVAARAAEKAKPTEQEVFEKEETRTKKTAKVQELVKVTGLRGEAEAEARAKSTGSHITKGQIAIKKRMAAIAQRLLEKYGQKEFEPVEDTKGKYALLERLEKILEDARDAGFKFARSSTHVSNTDAYVWLHDIKMMAEKLRKNMTNGKLDYPEINTFLMDHVALVARGDGSLMRERRLSTGAAMNARGGNAENVAAAQETDETVEKDEPTSQGKSEEEPDAKAETAPEGETKDEAKDEEYTPTEEVGSYADKQDIGAKVTANKRGVGSLTSYDLADQFAPQLEEMGLTPREWRELHDEDPAKADEIMEKAVAASVKRVTDDAAAEIAARYGATVKPRVLKAMGIWSRLTKTQPDDVQPALPFKNMPKLNKGQLAWKKYMREVLTETRNKLGIVLIESDNALIRSITHGYQDTEALFATHVLTTKEFLDVVQGNKEALRSGVKGVDWLSAREADELGVVGPRLLSVAAEVAPDVKIYILQDKDFDLYAKPGTAAYYTPAGDQIIVRASTASRMADMKRAVTHEIAHAASWHAIVLNKKSDAVKKFKQLFDIANDYMANSSNPFRLYGLTNIDEFMAEIWSNPVFRDWLATVPLTAQQKADLSIPKGSVSAKIKTVMDAVKFYIARAMGFYNSGQDIAALKIGLDLASKILDMGTAARKDYYSRSPQLAAGANTVLQAKESLGARLRAAGIPKEQVAEIVKIIREEFGGKVTDEQFDALVKEFDPKNDAQRIAKEKAASALSAQMSAAAKAERELAKQVEKELAEFTPEKNPGRIMGIRLALLSSAHLGQIADRYFGPSNPIRKVATLMEKRRTRKAHLFRAMGTVIEDLQAAQRRHPKKVWDSFVGLAHDATMANVHPDRPLEENKHLGKAAMSGVWGKAQHAKLAATYDALPDDLKELYQTTRDTLTKAQDDMAKLIIKNLLDRSLHPDPALLARLHRGEATDADRALVGPQVMHLIDNAQELRKIEGPYFNLTRRGKFVVRGTYKLTPPPNAKMIEDNIFEFKTRKEAEEFTGKQTLRPTMNSVWVDKNTGLTTGTENGVEVKISKNDTDAEQRFRVTVQNRHVQFTDTRKQALRLAKSLREEGLDVGDIEDLIWERQANNAQMMSDQMRVIEATLDKRAKDKNMSAQMKEELSGALHEIALRFMGSTRIASTMLPRRYVEGADKDLIHNTFDYVDRTAGYLARLETAPALEDALKEAHDRVNILSAKKTGAGEGARQLSNAITKKALDSASASRETWFDGASTRLRTLSFVDHLLSPAYSLLNAMQVGMLTIPVLSGDFNPVSANYHVAKAYKDVNALRMLGEGMVDTAKAVAGKKAFGDDYLSDVIGSIKEPREKEMLDYLGNEIGLIDPEGGMEMIRLHKDSPYRTVAFFDKGLGYFENIGRAQPQAIEAINRTVTALAAYRMMYGKTKDHAKAMKYAEDIVDNTQGNYSPTNSSAAFNHPVGALVLQFRKYGAAVYYLMGRNIGRIIKGGGPGERRKGMMTMAYILATQQVVAGTLGLPMEPLKFAIMALHGLGLSDESWEEFQQMIQDWLEYFTGDKKTAEVLAFGASRAIPGGWAFDMQGRVGMDSLLTFGEPRTDEESDVKAWLLDTVAGAAIGTGFDMVRGVGQFIEGDFGKAATNLIPAKIITDTMKGVQGVQEGKFDAKQAAVRAFGLTPAQQARNSRETSQQIRESKATKDVESKLISDYINAIRYGDWIKARRAIDKYNANPPEGRKKISYGGSLEERRLENKLRWQKNK